MRRLQWCSLLLAAVAVFGATVFFSFRSGEHQRLRREAAELLAYDLDRAAELDDIPAAKALSLLDGGPLLGEAAGAEDALRIDAALLVELQRGDLSRGKALLERTRAGAASPLRTLVEAEFARREGDNDRALALLHALTEARPTFLRGWVLRADLALDQRRGKMALAFLKNALAGHPDQPALQNRAALARELLHDEAGAELHLYRALAVDPSFLDAWLNLGRLRRAAGDQDGARRAFNRAIALAPGSSDAVLGRGLACAASTVGPCPAAARADFERAVELDPDAEAPRLALGDWFRAEGRLDDALAAYRSAIDRSTNGGAAWLKLGHALLLSGDEGRAERAYREAIRRDVRLAAAHNGLGAVLRLLGRHEEAAASLAAAARLDPKDPNPWFLLATLKDDTGRPREAAALRRRAEALRGRSAS